MKFRMKSQCNARMNQKIRIKMKKVQRNEGLQGNPPLWQMMLLSLNDTATI